LDVELPNGTVVHDVPDGTDKFTIMERAVKAGLATNEDFGQKTEHTEVSGTGYQEGIGRGLMHTLKRTGNLLGLYSDKDMKNSEDLDKDLMSITGGQLGNMTGEIAATLPVGGAVGAGLKGALAARGLVPGAELAAKVLGSGIGRGAVEGGLMGATQSESGEGADQTLFGAGMGGAWGAAGKLLGKVPDLLGLHISPEAAATQKLTGTFIPLSQSLVPGIGKQFYEAFLANLPGVGGKIRGQYTHAVEDIRRFAAEQAHPPTAPVNISGKDTISDAFGKLEDYWKNAYDELGQTPIKLFNGAGGRTAWSVPAEVEGAMKAASGGRFVPPQAGQVVNGEVMLNLKRATEELLEALPENSVLKKGAVKELEDFSQHIDDMLKQNLNPSGKGKGQMADLFKDYLAKQPYYEDYQRLLAAGQKALQSRGTSDFSMRELAAASARQTGRTALRGGGAGSLQETGRLGAASLPDFPSRQGLFQTAAALGLGGSFLVGGPAGVAGMMGAGRALASQRAQKLVSGQYNVMKNYAKMLRLVNRGSRSGAVVGGLNATGQ
jgi:hypothetical protein